MYLSASGGSNRLRNRLLIFFMGILKSGSSAIRKITKVGRASLAVTLPIDLVRKLKWRERQRVVITKKGKTLTIKDYKPKK